MWWVHLRLLVLFIFFYIGIFEISQWFTIPTVLMLVISISLGYEESEW